MENHVYIKKKFAFKSLCNHGKERKKERETRLNGHTDRRADRQTMTKE